jgi:hypothetical protein
MECLVKVTSVVDRDNADKVAASIITFFNAVSCPYRPLMGSLRAGAAVEIQQADIEIRKRSWTSCFLQYIIALEVAYTSKSFSCIIGCCASCADVTTSSEESSTLFRSNSMAIKLMYHFVMLEKNNYINNDNNNDTNNNTVGENNEANNNNNNNNSYSGRQFIRDVLRPPLEKLFLLLQRHDIEV